MTSMALAAGAMAGGNPPPPPPSPSALASRSSSQARAVGSCRSLTRYVASCSRPARPVGSRKLPARPVGITKVRRGPCGENLDGDEVPGSPPSSKKSSKKVYMNVLHLPNFAEDQFENVKNEAEVKEANFQGAVSDQFYGSHLMVGRALRNRDPLVPCTGI